MPTFKITGPKTREAVTVNLDCNVLEAAKQRLNWILDRYDSVVVAFSGGKDSLTVLHLLRQVQAERGMPDVVHAIFRDEELIPMSVINFVDHYRQLPWVRLKWFAVQLQSSKYLFGKSIDYVQWDKNRAHVRPKPEWAITEPSNRIFNQYTMDSEIASHYKGKVCILTGIRTQESLTRYRAIINKINETFVAATQSKRVDLGRPVYDWTENDVFKFFYDNQIEYAAIYNAQLFSGHPLRVATPLHSEGAKRLSLWRTIDPEFYDSVLQVFPEVAVQDLYGADVKELRGACEDPENFVELEEWIHKNFQGESLQVALKRYAEVMQRQVDPRVAKVYPFYYVLKQFKSGTIKRTFMPKTK